MENIFITSLQVNKLRNIEPVKVELGEEKKHLIITGKNGSGKSTLLQEINRFLNNIPNGSYAQFDANVETIHSYESAIENPAHANNERAISDWKKGLENTKKWFDRFGGIQINFSSSNKPEIHKQYSEGKLILAFFDAKRDTKLKQPTGINKFNFQPSYAPHENAKQEFIQYIVNLKADRSFAKDDNDTAAVEKIDLWFNFFQDQIQTLFDIENLKLVFDRNSYNFNIVEENKAPYNFNQLSDGYSAIISIVTELIMRMETNHNLFYDLHGIVLIDEIETHLHVDLQKKILPFLTAFFPKVQFIVSTHSPFVLSSIENCKIWDLEKGIITDDLSGYSYDALIESYFGSDKYSKILTEKLAKFEDLMKKDKLSDVEDKELYELKTYLKDIPKFLSDELAVKIQQIIIKEIKPKNDNAK